MRIIVSLLCFIFAAVQSFLTYVWTDPESKLQEQFNSVFLAFYENGIPLWSELAFSIGKWWYLLPGVLMLSLIYVWIRSATLGKISIVTLAGALGLFVMLYAMYPLHLMPSFSANA